MPDHLPQEPGDKSLWAATSIANPVTDLLRESLKADVLIVGGGYTGLSSALHLAEQGVSVILLEAKSIGFGGSGRNAGLVNAGVWQNPEHVVRELGPEAGGRFNLALRDSPGLVFELVRRFKMSCDADQCGTVNIAHKASAMNYLEDRYRQLRQLGASVELIEGDRAQSISASPVYSHGGILDNTAGTIHPLNYARSLALAASELGARIYQQSGVRRLERRNERWLASTDSGEISAEQVIMATNAYTDDNIKAVRDSIVPVFIFQCATAPLGEELASAIIPERQGLWDTQTLMTSSRIDAGGRLVMSSAGGLQGFQQAIRQNWMTRNRNRLFPQTRGVKWEYHWSGQVGVTSSKILRVQLLAPGVFAPAGYNGRGIGPGTTIGKCLADSIVSGNQDDLPFPVQVVHREKWSKLRAGYYRYGSLALQCLDRRQ